MANDKTVTLTRDEADCLALLADMAMEEYNLTLNSLSDEGVSALRKVVDEKAFAQLSQEAAKDCAEEIQWQQRDDYAARLRRKMREVNASR